MKRAQLLSALDSLPFTPPGTVSAEGCLATTSVFPVDRTITFLATFGHDAQPDFAQIKQPRESIAAPRGDNGVLGERLLVEQREGVVQATHRAFEEAYSHRVVPEIERVDGLHGIRR